MRPSASRAPIRTPRPMLAQRNFRAAMSEFVQIWLAICSVSRSGSRSSAVSASE